MFLWWPLEAAPAPPPSRCEPCVIQLLCARSLLEGSDTISIDTSVVTPQEFSCLLDMVYTGRLPVGKHNVSRVVAAADSLQMFDVAVGFKKVLSTLVKQQHGGPGASGPAPALEAPDPQRPPGAPETEREQEDDPEEPGTSLEPPETTGQQT